MKSLSFYPICKLMIACHSFMDACRYETPGSETKDLITHGTAGSLNFMFTMFLLHREARGCDTEQPRWTLQCSASVSWLRSPECLKGVQGPNFKGIILLKGTASKPAQPLSGVLCPRGRLYIFQGCLLDKCLSKDSTEKTLNASGHKTCRNAWDPWRIVF